MDERFAYTEKLEAAVTGLGEVSFFFAVTQLEAQIVHFIDPRGNIPDKEAFLKACERSVIEPEMVVAALLGKVDVGENWMLNNAPRMDRLLFKAKPPEKLTEADMRMAIALSVHAERHSLSTKISRAKIYGTYPNPEDITRLNTLDAIITRLTSRNTPTPKHLPIA